MARLPPRRPSTAPTTALDDPSGNATQGEADGVSQAERHARRWQGWAGAACGDVPRVYKNFKRTFCHPAARTPQSACYGMAVRTHVSATSPR